VDYKASLHVRDGIMDVHALNLFLSFEEICSRLGLWAESVGWQKGEKSFYRITGQTFNKDMQRRYDGQALIQERLRDDTDEQ
jgi:hypothetical protein